jgi:hypothetical protein
MVDMKSINSKYRFIAKTQTIPKPCRGCPMAKTYTHVMQISLYSENLNYAEVAQWRKPISMLCKMTLHSENLNYAEVAQWRKPISMLCKCRLMAKT